MERSTMDIFKDLENDGLLSEIPVDALRQPTDAATLTAIGLVYKNANKLPKAISLLKKAVEADPECISAKQNLCVVLTDWGTHLKVSGNIQDGLTMYNKALKYAENYAPAHYNIGVVYSELHDFNEAAKHYQRAIEYNPRYSEAYCNLGVIYKEMGKNKEAVEYYLQALASNHGLEVARYNLAIALTDLGTQVKAQSSRKEAMRLYKQALFYNHKYWNAHYNLGVAYGEIGNYVRATFYYKLATEFNPQCAMAYNNLGVIEKILGNFDRAIEYYKAALTISPKFSQTLNNIGVIYMMQGHLEEAFTYLNAAITEDPNYVEAYNNIGILFRDECDIEQSLKFYEQCIKMEPNTRNANHNRLLAMNYLPKFDAKRIIRAHEEWGDQFASQYEKYLTYDNDRNLNDRKIIVGYISPDYFVHSVSYFIEAILKQYNKEKFYTICYSNVARPDHKTDLFKTYVDLWRRVEGIESAQVAEQIRKDKVDILVELTGHTAGNRLDVMAHKPAPIQITWIGYPNTTGLKTIDYRFTDVLCDPLDTNQLFTEKLIRLPKCFLCYTPADDAPPTVRLPCLVNGYITFGSFNNLAKMTYPVIQTWASIVLSVPKSRLFLKCKSFTSEKVKNKIWMAFSKLGVESSRIDLLGLLPNNRDHLSSYELMDFSLDTFPYAGTTTTCEALYMGVPVITLKGTCHAANVGVSLLSQIEGHSRFIANSIEEYKTIAVDLANNLPLLQELRRTTRQKMLESYLCDSKTFTQNLENVYISLLQDWSNNSKITTETNNNEEEEKSI